MVDHPSILNAYLARISSADLQLIVNAKEAAVRASLNEGTRAQLAAQDAMAIACADAMRRVSDHDTALIEQITASRYDRKL